MKNNFFVGVVIFMVVLTGILIVSGIIQTPFNDDFASELQEMAQSSDSELDDSSLVSVKPRSQKTLISD